MKYFWLFVIGIVMIVHSAQAQQDARVNVRDLQDLQQPTDFSGEGIRAQGVVNPYDPKYRPAHFNNQGVVDPFFNPGPFLLQFIRPPVSGGEAQAVLRISQPVNIGGCFRSADSAPILRIDSQVLTVKVPAPTVSVENNTRYAQYGCAHTSRQVVTDIPLALDTLKEGNINTLVLSNERGHDRFDIRWDEQSVWLTPRTSRAFKPAGGKSGHNALRHWFYPDNVIIVQVPTRQGGEVFWQIEQWALKNNLVPLDLRWKNFNQPSQNNKIYYIDEDNLLAPTLVRFETRPVGHVVLPETWYGRQGPYEVGTRIQITAKKPGLHD